MHMVQDWMGRDDANLTLRRYGRWVRDDSRRLSVAKLSQAWGGGHAGDTKGKLGTTKAATH